VLVLKTDPEPGRTAIERWAHDLEHMHEYDFVITCVQMISPTKAPNAKLSAMAAKSHSMCVKNQGPLFDLLICDEAHHAIADSWKIIFQALAPIAQTVITATGNKHDLHPKQVLLTGTSHKLQQDNYPGKPHHKLRIWTLTQGFQGLFMADGSREKVLLKHTVLYEVRIHTRQGHLHAL
jgi:hypothetical protein